MKVMGIWFLSLTVMRHPAHTVWIHWLVSRLYSSMDMSNCDTVDQPKTYGQALRLDPKNPVFYSVQLTFF